jgi:hypothetical protein
MMQRRSYHLKVREGNLHNCLWLPQSRRFWTGNLITNMNYKCICKTPQLITRYKFYPAFTNKSTDTPLIIRTVNLNILRFLIKAIHSHNFVVLSLTPFNHITQILYLLYSSIDVFSISYSQHNWYEHYLESNFVRDVKEKSNRKRIIWYIKYAHTY